MSELKSVLLAASLAKGGSEWDRNFTIGEVPPLPPSGGGGIIEVDVLPTENINKDAFYYLKPSVDNTIAGTWVFNDEIDLSSLKNTSLKFISNGREYINIGLTVVGSSSWGINSLRYEYIISNEDFTGDNPYTHNPSGNYGITHGWLDEAYKTIEILEEPTDESFITWLRANATKQDAVDNSGYYKAVEKSRFNDELTDLAEGTYSVIFTFTDTNGYIRNGTAIRLSTWGGGIGADMYFVTDAEGIGVCRKNPGGSMNSWSSDVYKTIEIVEMPADEIFCAWLNENISTVTVLTKYNATAGAKKITNNGTFDVSTLETVVASVPAAYQIPNPGDFSANAPNGSLAIVGEYPKKCTRYVFNDEIDLQALIDISNPYEGRLTFESNSYSATEFRIYYQIRVRRYEYDDGSVEVFMNYEYPYHENWGSDGDAYSSLQGWMNEMQKTVYVCECTDETLLAWLDANATKTEITPAVYTKEDDGWAKLGDFGSGASEGALAYHVSSVDELPADAIDGSLAMVEVPHPVLGTWMFNETIEMGYTQLQGNFVSNGKNINNIQCYGVLRYYLSDGDDGTGTNIEAYSEGAWVDEEYRTLTISKVTTVDYTTFLSWLTNNTTRVETATAYAFYSHENGEWVYKTQT